MKRSEFILNTMGKRRFILYFLLYFIVPMLVALFLSHRLPNHNNGNHPYHRHLPFLEHHFTDIPPEFTNRIVHFFPDIGKKPTEWFVSLDEITQRILQQAQSEMDHSVKLLKFDSYDNSNFLRMEEHFNASDTDGNGVLNLIEFMDFLNPAQSKNPKLRQLLSKVEIRERETDRDGKVSFKEFFHGLFDFVYASPTVFFSQLDKDGDGYLSYVELSPIIGKPHPSWHEYAKQQAEYITSQAEDDNDGRLTLADMIKHPYLFYSAIFNNDRDEYHDTSLASFH